LRPTSDARATGLALIAGLGPLLAGTRTLEAGIMLGLASLLVVTTATALVALLGRHLTPAWRLPASIVVTGALVTAVDLVLATGWLGTGADLRPFVPLIIINGLLLATVEAGSSRAPREAVRAALAAGGAGALLLAAFGGIRGWLAPALPVAALAPAAFFLLAGLAAVREARAARRRAP